MARPRTPKKPKKVEDYEHKEAKRLNNPPAGLAWQDTEKPPKRRYEYDPHLDPQLMWAGKSERTSFEVEAPSIHVHERLSTEAIIRAVQKEPPQPALFGDEELDRSKAVEFYQHEQDWVNRLILGDSLVVMTSLLEKERFGGQVQMIYVDPPYGINYNSNFQARISNRTPTETKDETITREPEQIRAYRDTWSLGVHSYLTYLRDRLRMCHELLSDEGSVFVQIGPQNVHLVRALMDEVFGSSNRLPLITAQKTQPLGARGLPEVADFLVWYAKNASSAKYRQLVLPKLPGQAGGTPYNRVELPDGTRRPLTGAERDDLSLLPTGARVYSLGDLTSQGFRPNTTIPYEFEGRVFHPGPNNCWKTTKGGLDRLAALGRLEATQSRLGYVRYLDDFPGVQLDSVWSDTGSSFMPGKRFVVQTNPKIVARCLLMTTDPGDLVFDPTCGSGTTSFVAEQYGRRWITCDTSRIAVAIARERILTSRFPYYELVDEDRGVDAGFHYATIPRITLGRLARNESSEQVVLHDQPKVDESRVRVSGPFSVEALSRYSINPLQEEVPPEPEDPQAAETQDHVETLLDALRKHGIPRNGKPLKIETLQRVAGTGAIHAEGTYRANGKEKSFAVSLGSRYGPVTVAQIDEALHDAYGYGLVVFVGFAATAEAQQYVAKGKLGKFELALLAANPDLLVGDLLKSTPSSQTFRLFSSPDAEVLTEKDGKVRVHVIGVDTFDAATGKVSSGEQKDVAAWFLDQDYDGIVFHVNQAFFPRTNGWEALQRALKGTIDPDLMEQLESFESLPFEPGEYRKTAVRVVTDDGNVSEAVLEL